MLWSTCTGLARDTYQVLPLLKELGVLFYLNTYLVSDKEAEVQSSKTFAQGHPAVLPNDLLCVHPRVNFGVCSARPTSDPLAMSTKSVGLSQDFQGSLS